MSTSLPASDDDLSSLTAAARAVRSGAAKPTRLVEHAVARCEANAEFNPIASLDVERALDEADRLEREAARGVFRGPLHGVPITVKDLFNVSGLPTRAGTHANLPAAGPHEAAAVARLRNAGAVILAKTHMQEIALGLNGENPWTGDVKNPHDPARQAGGSSSGSACAVALGIGWASLGSDTAGSIRVPASFCGIVGFKPSHGRVPMEGALGLIPSCDHAGPLARSVADACVMTEVLAGTSIDPRRHAEAPLRLGVPRAYLEGALTADVREAFEALLRALPGRGVAARNVSLDLGDPIAAYQPLRAESLFIHRHALEAQPEAFAPNVREALRRGYEFSALQYLEARQRQLEMRAAIEQALQGIDALVLPAAPCVAPTRGTVEIDLESGTKDLRQAILHLSVPAAFAGVPAISLPFAWSSGLPIGLQVIAPFATDERALAVAQRIEGLLRGNA
jgi:aspartyl-tRNA(Asn)/glutamyl-tRNA(Gln) amidotransferase subunit A